MEYLQYLPVLMAATGIVLRGYLSSKELHAETKAREMSKASMTPASPVRKIGVTQVTNKQSAFGADMAHA